MIQVYEEGGKRPGWKFRTVDEAGDVGYVSNGVYGTEEACRHVAAEVNKLMWAGGHKIRKVRAPRKRK